MNSPEDQLSRITRFLQECANLPDRTGEPGLVSIRSAILVEDAFDVVLTDDQVSIDLLRHPDRLRQLLAQTSTRL